VKEQLMMDIRHRVGITATPQDVFGRLATGDGLAQWWTRKLKGDSVPGGQLAFYFGSPEPGAVMEVIDLVESERVGWRCVEGPAEWLDTSVTFDLRANGDETVILFTHGGWREPVEFMHHCSTKWAYFLMSLKDGLEGGASTPFPDDVKISSWG
jgi:uncharacterized protein YndB with AHSA1/START domain